MLSKRRVTITEETTTTVVTLGSYGCCPCPVCGHRPNDVAATSCPPSAELEPIQDEANAPALATNALNTSRAVLKAGEKVEQKRSFKEN